MFGDYGGLHFEAGVFTARFPAVCSWW